MNKVNKLIFYFLLVLFFVYNTFYLYHNIIISKDSWNVGDWLINYQDGGFKRRGLLGSLILLIHDSIRVKLEMIVFIIVEFLQITFYYLLVRLLKDNKNIAILSLLLSPLVLQCSMVDPNIIGKKDVLVFATFAYFVYIINRNEKRKYFLYILLFAVTLIHEYFIFFIGYFIWALILSKKYSYKDYAFTFFSVAAPVILIFFLGGNINEGTSFQLLKERGLDLHNSGILAWKYDGKVPTDIWNAWNFYSLYLISLAIGFFHFFYFLKVYFYKSYLNKIFVFIGLLLCSLPLFYLGTDWGRWLNIHFTLLLLTILPLKKESNSNSKNNIIFIVICCSTFLWGFNHFGEGFHFYSKFNILVTKIFNYLF